MQSKQIERKLRLTNGDVDGILEIVSAGARLTVDGLRSELELFELINDFCERILLDRAINRPAVECPQGVLVVECGLLAARASGLVKLIEGKIELFVKDGLNVGSSSSKRAWHHLVYSASHIP
jgi:hypothetical protein